MSNVPTNLIPSTITQLPEYTGDSTLGYLPYSLGGRTYKVQFSNIAAVGAVPSTRVIATGNGLQGGGDLSQNRTISIISHGVGYSQLDFTGVTAGTYGSADTIPAITVDDTGRVTAVVDTPIVLADYVPSSRTITAGSGLTGGGQLNNNITIALDPSDATPQSLGVASAGTGEQAARDDHVHPAVDLTDTSETQGVLPLGRGGTGVALSPVVGAVIYADNDSLNQTVAGNAGQILTSAGGLGAPYWQTVTGTGTVTSVDLTAGTGISVSGGPITTTGSITVTNTAPDQVVSLTGAGTTSITGTYPNFTITSNDQYVGTVTSVALSGGTTGLTVSGSPITTAGTITLGGTLAVANGGTGAGTAATARSNLGAAASGANTDITSIALTTGTVSTAPANSTDIANKSYVDGLVTSGISYHTPVKYEVPNTTGNLTATYNNGTAGVGATLTNAGALAAFTPDGVVASVGDRILIYNQTNAAQNGVYTVTTVGSGSVAWVLTRATDADSYGLKDPDALGNGDAFFITSGSTGAGETYVCNTPGTITFGTTAISFTQVSASQVYSAGTGLTLTGTVFSLTAPVAVSLGGTGATTLSSGYLVKGNGTSAVSASVVYDNGTNVGIGTSTPAQQFHVNNTSGDAISLITGGTGFSGNLFINGGRSNLTGALRITSFSGGNAEITNASNSNLLLGTNNAERMRIDASGNVGIGTSAPVDKLQVEGNLYFGTSNRVVYSGGSANLTLQTGTGVLAFNTGGSVERMRITNSGYVSIGSTTPGSSKLYVYDANVSITTNEVAAAGTGVASNRWKYSTNHYGIYVGSVNAMVFYDYGANAERMRIDSSGNVGIGTNSPTEKLVLNSGSAVQTATKYINTNTTGVSVGAAADGSAFVYQAAALPFIVYTNASERLRIDSSGNVGIGLSTPTYRVDTSSASFAGVRSTSTDATSFNQFNLTTGTSIGLLRQYGQSHATKANELSMVSVSGPITFAPGATERFRIEGNGAIGLSGANYGTSGQVLTSNGSGSAPTWQPASGGLSRAQVTAISMILGF